MPEARQNDFAAPAYNPGLDSRAVHDPALAATRFERNKPMDTTTIERMIRAGLPDAEVSVSGADGVHFEARIVSPSFAGKTTLQRHRMVYATLGEYMGREIHALALRTDLPGD